MERDKEDFDQREHVDEMEDEEEPDEEELAGIIPTVTGEGTVEKQTSIVETGNADSRALAGCKQPCSTDQPETSLCLAGDPRRAEQICGFNLGHRMADGRKCDCHKTRTTCLDK
ncbi:hypothetical protein STEG23_017917, partial [Scotinomys teguina]